MALLYLINYNKYALYTKNIEEDYCWIYRYNAYIRPVMGGRYKMIL